MHFKKAKWQKLIKINVLLGMSVAVAKEGSCQRRV